MACKRVAQGQVTVYIDSSKVIGTDHEILSSSFRVRARRTHQRHCTRPRVWVGGHQHLDNIDQDSLMQLARTCTKPRPGYAYKDPPEVKRAARQARLSKTAAAWKEVRRLRKQARLTWEQQRVLRATSGDWSAFRSCKPQADMGWVEGFANAQTRDPHQAVHDHLTKVYAGRAPAPNVGPPSETVVGFSEFELDTALGQMQSGKSVGSDGTSKELLVGVCEIEGGKVLLLEFLTRVLTTQEIPDQWNTPLMILLPKLTQPVHPRDLRPISMSSAVSKLFSRLLLNRCLDRLSLTTHSQCSGPGRQTADYVFAIWRVLELEREWHRGLCVAKLDVSKAFDTVSREKILEKLQQRLGESAEMRCWRSLLQQNHGILQSPWGVSRVCMQQGIKQGSVESPHLFALVAELCLAETAERFGWKAQQQVFEGMEHQDMLYMDDCLLWGRGTEGLAQRIRQFQTVLSEYGLSLNSRKCQLLVSPHWDGPKHISISGVRVDASESLGVMGLDMRVGMSMTELIGPLLSRARNKFWANKHLLRSHAPLRARLQLLERICGGAALWCVAALPPDRSSLGILNACQMQLVIWAMRLGKRNGETWECFHKRAYRSARLILHGLEIERWGTTWLRRWWRYAGHRARAQLHDAPPISTLLDGFRTLEWWQYEQKKKDGLHHTRHYPKLMNMERAMNAGAQGQWRVVAQNRALWREREQGFVDRQDLPWASGRQTQILNTS